MGIFFVSGGSDEKGEWGLLDSCTNLSLNTPAERSTFPDFCTIGAGGDRSHSNQPSTPRPTDIWLSWARVRDDRSRQTACLPRTHTLNYATTNSTPLCHMRQAMPCQNAPRTGAPTHSLRPGGWVQSGEAGGEGELLVPLVLLLAFSRPAPRRPDDQGPDPTLALLVLLCHTQACWCARVHMFLHGG